MGRPKEKAKFKRAVLTWLWPKTCLESIEIQDFENDPDLTIIEIRGLKGEITLKIDK